MRLLAVALLIAISAAAANVKLYLKDGSYQIVREYQRVEDRIRYYSVERSDWEEMPAELVDLKKTEAEIKSRQDSLKEEAAILAAEDRAEREAAEEVAKVPQNTGVYVVQGKELATLKQAESKVNSNKRRSVLKVLSPIPIVAGKATVELDGDHSALVVETNTPEFYIRLFAEERFGIARLKPGKNTRIVQNWTIVPVTKEIVEEMDLVEIFRRQVDDGVYKIWPMKPLEPGEYAVVEYTEGKGNVQIWDFGYRAAKSTAK